MMKKELLLMLFFGIVIIDTFGQNSPFSIYGTGLDGSTYQKTAIYSDTQYGLLIEAPLTPGNQKLPITFSWRGGGSYPFYINALENVGIGTNNPLGKLEVKGPYSGNSQLIINSTASNSELRFSSNDVTKGFVWYNFGDDCMAFGRGSLSNSLFVNSAGNFGVGTNNPTNKLDVKGTIHAQEVKVDLTGWSDFVFHPSYQLKPLTEVEQFIKTNGHLQDIPSAADVEQNGVNVGEMQKKLLQKVEELTLYVIEQNKRIESLEKVNQLQNEEIVRLKKENK